jgi:putative ABC transport system permease protein
MKLMMRMTVRTLAQNKKRTVLTLLAAALSAGMLFAVSTIAASFYGAMLKYGAANHHDYEQNLAPFKGMLDTLTAVLAVIIMAGAVVVIANAFTISAGERVRQFGILKSVGATKKQIRRSVTFEGIIISAIGVPAGLAVGAGFSAIGVAILNTFLSGEAKKIVLGAGAEDATGMTFGLVITPSALILTIALTFIAIMLSSMIIARKVAKLTALQAIRNEGEVKINPRSVKTSKLTAKIFGFEGTLAAKSLKRSKRKYRATVVSLVVSIVLVISASTLGGVLFQMADTLLPGGGQADVILTAWTNNVSMEDIDALTKEFDKFPGGAKSKWIIDGWAYVGERSESGGLIAHLSFEQLILDEESYEAYIKEIGAASGDAVLIYRDTKQLPDLKELDSNDGRVNITPVIKTSYANSLIRNYYREGEDEPPALVLPREKAVDIEENSIFVRWNIETEDPAGFGVYAEKVSMDLLGSNAVDNDTAYAKEMKSLFTVVMVFVYGFVAMLTVIGVTSVLSTVYSNIKLRAPELAILGAVGMDKRGLRRMLNLESIMYGITALLIGLPIGVICSFALQTVIGQRLGTGYTIPWPAMLASAAGTFVITFISMHYAARQQKKQSIADTMRTVNI